MKKIFVFILVIFIGVLGFYLWNTYGPKAYYNERMMTFKNEIMEKYPEIKDVKYSMYGTIFDIAFSIGKEEMTKEELIVLKEDVASFFPYSEIKKLGNSYWNEERYADSFQVNIFLNESISKDDAPTFRLETEERYNFNSYRVRAERPLDEYDNYYKKWSITDLRTLETIYNDYDKE